MAKDKDRVRESVEVEAFEVPQAVPVAAPKVMVLAPRHKIYTIEQWAQLRNKPARHLGGIKAFLGSEAGNKYPLDMWDAKMSAY